MEREMTLAKLDRMAGVMPAVIASHDIEAIGEQIDDLALAFVAPLPPQHRYDLHGMASWSRIAKTTQDSRLPASIQSRR